jgi:hypothetical protein
MEDDIKMVEIARFQFNSDAQALVALLRSEGIDCYLRNETSNQVFAGYVDIGGVRVEILETEVEHAMEVMRSGGYEIPEEDELPETVQAIGGWSKNIPWLNSLSFEKQLIVLFVIIAVFLGLLIYFGSNDLL